MEKLKEKHWSETAEVKRLKDLSQEPKEGRAFLAMGPHIWGKGPSIQEAVKRALREGAPRGRVPIIVWEVTPEAYVDGMGSLCWSTPDGTPADGSPHAPVEQMRFVIRRS